MRSIIAGGSLGVLMFAVGCNIAPHRRDGGPGATAPVAATAPPTVDNLVGYLNNNADAVKAGQAITSGNITIDVNADGQKVGIGGMMLCQTPRNFLLSGKVLGSPAVDIGSNDKEFWFWSRELKTPENQAYLYHCSYDDLARGTKVPFPFQPDMVVSALGLAKYDPVKPYLLKIEDDKRGHKTILLTEQARSPENKPIQRITVFNFHQVQQESQPQVLAHILKDEQGKVICAANIRSAQRVGGERGPIIPRIIDFDWPEQKLKMTMTIYNPRITAMPPERAATVFTRGNLNYQSFDLATRTLDGGLQRAGASAPPTSYPR
jgi:hypothetical protein